MIEKLNCMKIMEFKSEHWLMVLCWGELDNEQEDHDGPISLTWAYL